MRKSIACLLFGVSCLFPGMAFAVVTVYTDEATFLNALASLGSSTIQESFENDAVWGVARSPLTAASITSLGITWTTNHTVTNEITTSGGNARTGAWGVFDSDHGYSTGTISQCDVTNPPELCFMHDGFSGSIPSPDLIYGVGGYIFGYAGADVDIIIDGNAHNAGPLSGLDYQFMGVIDTEGFNSFEYRETEGTVEQQLFIFGDDFTIATSAISPVNNAPVANAGADQNTNLNDTVTLDGSASSDADGDSLTYSWSLTSVPAGSSATLSSATVVMPSFLADVSGDYVAQLVVNDGTENSLPDSVTISTSVSNVKPIADAGLDQSITTGTTVTLDGSASSDADGDSLTYSWSLTSIPAGSSATLSSATAVKPSFLVDLPGEYIAQLVVNDGLVDSVPDTVTVNTSNVAPVANAGPDQSVAVNDVVMLDGSGSTDADSDQLTFNWSFISKPAGSTASLSSSTDVMPDFQVDEAGTYIVQLIVNDGLVDSAADSVILSTGNIAPVANAGVDQDVIVDDLVVLDGSASSDANNDPLTFNWSFNSRPTGSVASLSSSTDVMPTFQPDVEGDYIIQLLVNDGTTDSNPAVVTINAAASTTTTTSGSSDGGSLSTVHSLFAGILILLIARLRHFLQRSSLAGKD